MKIVDLSEAKTKVVSSMLGWGTEKYWDQAYDFSARPNEWTNRQFAKYLSIRDPRIATKKNLNSARLRSASRNTALGGTSREGANVSNHRLRTISWHRV
jgi:hypothetical protein